MNIKFNEKLEEFLSSIYIVSHSYSSVSSYRLAITNKNNGGFHEFLSEKYQIDELELVEKIKQKEFDVYEILSKFVLFLDANGYKPKGIHSRLSVVKGFLRHLKADISSDTCKQRVRLPRNIHNREKPITKDIILQLLRNIPPKLQTVILVLSASGMRLGELVQFRLEDVDFTTNPVTIRLRAETTKTRTEREVYLTNEATESLKDYLKRVFQWDESTENFHLQNKTVFASPNADNPKNKQPPHLQSESLLQNILRYHTKKIPQLCIKNENGRNVIHFHSLRKFFRTIVGDKCGRDFAEDMIGHRFYMDTYYQLTTEKRKEMYLDAEPFLTISDYKAVENNMKSLSVKYKDLETKVDDLMSYLRTNSIEVPDFLRT
jgi:integrase